MPSLVMPPVSQIFGNSQRASARPSWPTDSENQTEGPNSPRSRGADAGGGGRLSRSRARSVSAAIFDLPSLGIYAHLLESGLYFYTAGSLIAYMLQDHSVSSDELFAAGATFTLLAWAFAFAFSVCQQWYPGSFTAAVDPTSARSWMELLFLSFSLLSGVGLSDVVPILPQARALVMLEQFAGVMYIAVVVSRLIGLTILKSPARKAE